MDMEPPNIARPLGLQKDVTCRAAVIREIVAGERICRDNHQNSVIA